MTDLKPCPLCGSPAILGNRSGDIYVMCDNDKCGIQVSTEEYFGDYALDIPNSLSNNLSRQAGARGAR